MTLGRIPGRAVLLLYGLALAGCIAAHTSGQPNAPGIDALSSGRAAALVGGLVGLTGAVMGGLALARSGRLGTGDGRRRAMLAIAAGLFGMALGGLVATTSPGGIGSGNGVGGAIVAMVVGLIGVVLGGLALARFRRAV
jgi:hypothetical protein